MPLTKKSPSVLVETRKISSHDEGSCCSASAPCCGKAMKVLMFLLLLVNTLLLVYVLTSQSKNEAAKVGGRENYQLVKQIYKSPAFQAQQKSQIEQAIQMFQGAAQQQALPQAQMPSQPEVQPMVQPEAQPMVQPEVQPTQ